MCGHAYTLVGAHKLNNGTELVRMRNPHGKNEYTGPWSDKSAEWDTVTQAEKAKLHVDATDGFFYMSFEAYWSHFRRTDIIPDVANNANWHSAKFLVIDDDGKNARVLKYTGKYEHRLVIKSDVA